MNDSNQSSTYDHTEAKSRTLREILRVLVLTVHRFRWALAVIVGMVSAGQMVRATQKADGVLKTKTVIAEKYELPRADGKTSAVLSRDHAGLATLDFLDDKGRLSPCPRYESGRYARNYDVR